jgi:hypothetical protein
MSTEQLVAVITLAEAVSGGIPAEIARARAYLDSLCEHWNGGRSYPPGVRRELYILGLRHFPK